jgi:hypothetical protein
MIINGYTKVLVILLLTKQPHLPQNKILQHSPFTFF